MSVKILTPPRYPERSHTGFVALASLLTRFGGLWRAKLGGEDCRLSVFERRDEGATGCAWLVTD